MKRDSDLKPEIVLILFMNCEFVNFQDHLDLDCNKSKIPRYLFFIVPIFL